VTPQDFIAKWNGSTLKERAAAQEHFIDLCRLLGEKSPKEADPNGEWYAFEKGAMKTGGGDGWADVWKRGCFAWEYKSPGKNLNTALKQLQYYVAVPLGDREAHGQPPGVIRTRPKRAQAGNRHNYSPCAGRRLRCGQRSSGAAMSASAGFRRRG